jgi:hypothetical protein
MWSYVAVNSKLVKQFRRGFEPLGGTSTGGWVKMGDGVPKGA